MSIDRKKNFMELLNTHVKIYANDVFDDGESRKRFIDFYSQPNIESNKELLLNFRSVGKTPSIYINEKDSESNSKDKVINEFNQYKKEIEEELLSSDDQPKNDSTQMNDETKESHEAKEIHEHKESHNTKTQLFNNTRVFKNLSRLGQNNE
jgi:hypothetical protein